jgi:hypothetical protein
MENLKKLSINEKQDIAISNDSENLKRLCAEILNAPILNMYRPKIYEMAEYMTLQPILTPCCKQVHIYCQCNAD